MTAVEFGRVHQGKVWHLLIPGNLIARDVPLCGQRGHVRQVCRNEPPRGERVCTDCASYIAGVHTTITRATAEAAPEQPEGTTL